MQLAARSWRLAAPATRTVAKPQSAKAAPKAKKCYWSSAVTRATKEPAPLDEATLAALRASVPPPPAPTEQFQHTPIPADMLEEAKAFREEVEKAEYEEDQIAMVDLVQTIATQVGLLQRAAEFLKKDVRDVTALDAATYRLHEHEEFVSKVQLDKVVLFSHENTLNNFRAGVKAISARYDNNKLPEGLQARLNEVDAVLAARVEEQEIIELKVSEEIYQSVQENLFPSFVKKGITPQEYLDFVGGPEGLIDPVTFHVRDLLIALDKAPSGGRAALLEKLEETIDDFETNEAEDFTPEEEAGLYGVAVAQDAAELSMKIKMGLNRKVVMGDLTPERRLERGLEISHPILDLDQVRYMHGDVTNVKEAAKQIAADQAPTVEFVARDNFNPPTGYRPLDAHQLELEPETAKFAQKAALNFPLWEGIEAASAINSGELIVEMKLFKLFNHTYPMLSDSKEAQELFMEMYDVSPGEPTLEWALSYPATEHTFFPEHPLWIHVFEDDEDFAPVVWPDYAPIYLEGAAEVSSAKNTGTATVRFLPQTAEQIAAEAHYNFAFAALPAEKRFTTPQAEVKKAAAALSADDKKKAEAAWAALSGADRSVARTSWTFEPNPEFTAANFVANQEALSKLQQRALSQKL